MQTQWNHGMNGRTGLNYLVLFQFMKRMKLSPHEYDDLLDDIQVMEVAALEEIYSSGDD